MREEEGAAFRDRTPPSEREIGADPHPPPLNQTTARLSSPASSLTSPQVQAVMGVLCDETDIAELSVRLGGFELHVRRSLKPGGGAGSATAAAANSAAPPIPTPPPASAFASTASMDGAGLPVGMSIATTATTSLDEEEETMILLGAPKVGVMRRGRYVKGKAVGKGPVVEVGATIKKGQVLGFVEQLGTFVTIESPQAGELVSFLADEGAPVEYGEPVCEIAPYFSGHIIGDAKHF